MVWAGILRIDMSINTFCHLLSMVLFNQVIISWPRMLKATNPPPNNILLITVQRV